MARQRQAVQRDYEQELVDDIMSYANKPLAFVKYAFPWRSGELKNHDGPDEWQADILNAIGDGLISTKEAIQIAVASGHDIGKALSVDTIIPTPTGPRRMDSLSPGDKVYGRDGKPTTITGVYPQGIRPMYRLTLDDGSSVVCDESHLWSVRGRQERRKGLPTYRTLTTQQIVDAGVQRSNGSSTTRQWELPQCKPVQGFIQASMAYAVGVWLGDGGAGAGRYRKPYHEVADHLSESGLVVKTGTDGQTHYVHGLYTELQRLGLYDLHSYDRFLPSECLDWVQDDRAELLRGLLDTDGECTPSGTIVYSSSSLPLAEGVISLARSLGGKAQLHPTTKEGWIGDTRYRDCHRATIRMPDEFGPFYVAHKAERVRDTQSNRELVRWIDKIERVEDQLAVCIRVDAPDSLFLCNDYVTTHNSSLVSWIILWSMSTMMDTRGVVTAETENQLRTKTWPELAKWHSLSINKHWFTLTATAIFSTMKDHEKTWRIDCVPWSETNTEAFQGLHNQGKRVVLLFDEASAIVDKIWEVSEGAMLDTDTEIIWAVFGNPTRNTGRFRECFGRFRHRWIQRQIDSRTCRIANKQKIQEWIEDYGEDSDFVKVRVRGLFPSMSLKQFISVEDVDKAYGRSLRPEQYSFAPKIISCDPAWEGDDELVISLRQGLAFSILRTIPKNDNDTQIATLLATLEDEHNADAVFIDGGYGTGIVSVGKSLGRSWKLVWFGEKSGTKGAFNKRAEMWMLMKQWLKDGGAIPADPVLRDDLIGPELIGRTDGVLQLESKRDMKKRGIASPNRADALALTFAYPVNPRMVTRGMLHLVQPINQAPDWSPFDY